MKKMNFFKKVAVLMIAAMAFTMSVSAQEQGDKAVGASVYLGTGSAVSTSYSMIGIGGKFRYNILDMLRAEAQATYYLPKNYWSLLDVSVNAHYLFPISDRLTFYPLAGIGLNYFIWDPGFGTLSKSSSSYTSINVGGGLDLGITDNLFINAEVTYRLTDWWDRLTLSGGIVLKF